MIIELLGYIIAIGVCVISVSVLYFYFYKYLLEREKFYDNKYDNKYAKKYMDNMFDFLQIETFKTLNEPARGELELLHKGELPRMIVKFDGYPEYVLEKVGETFFISESMLVQSYDMKSMIEHMVQQAKRNIAERIHFKVEKFPVPESKSWEFIITTTIAVSKELYQEQKKVHF
jgi:hypothetical protein